MSLRELAIGWACVTFLTIVSVGCVCLVHARHKRVKYGPVNAWDCESDTLNTMREVHFEIESVGVAVDV